MTPQGGEPFRLSLRGSTPRDRGELSGNQVMVLDWVTQQEMPELLSEHRGPTAAVRGLARPKSAS